MNAPNNLKKLFTEAMAADKGVEKAQKAVEEAIEIRSKAVKAIYDAAGGSNGPYNYQGSIYQIRARVEKVKDEEGNVVKDKDGKPLVKKDGKETWYFVSMGDKEVMNVG
jgi:hypothetical protein